jgi:hypothetical protein
MAYVCERPPVRRIRIPKRTWNSGFGQAGFNSDFCTFFGLTSGWCQQYSTQAPTLSPGAAAPGLPIGYDASSGTISGNATGATAANPYGVTYSVPAGACDWTQVDWTDPTTWCTATWVLIGLAGAAIAAAMFAAKGAR